MNLRATVCALSLCTVLLGMAPAHAGVFSINAPASVEQGTKGIVVSLFESGISGLEAADILFTFDSSVFDYVSTELGNAITSGFFLLANETAPGSVDISLSSDLPVTATDGSLLDVTLDVRNDAPLGTLATAFRFEAISSDYDFPQQVAGLTVTATGATPEPLSILLVAIGLGALCLFQRRTARI